MPPVPPATGIRLSPVLLGVATIVSQTLLRSALALPYTLVSVLIVARFHLTYDSVLAIMARPFANMAPLAGAATLSCLAVVATVWLEAVVAKALGTVGEGVISRWSPAYIRVWLKAGLVSSAGNWLSGGLFWPVWLRLAGMRVGSGCEISTIIDVVPELVRIRPGTFLADGIYLGGPRIQRGSVTLAHVVLGSATFLGNHVVVAGGQRLPADILIGVCTVADDRVVRPGSSWFGHPAFELPHREVVDCDRALTHNPSSVRLVNRLFWEWLRFALPVVPVASVVIWVAGILFMAAVLPVGALLLVWVPVVTLTTAGLLCLFVLALKWALLGRVRPGTHPLWSCWCSRWDFLYVAWGAIAGGILSALEGTLLLAVYLRGMGMRIGRRVLLSDGFAQVVDPDMIDIGEGATVSAMFQAHTFEDRVLKIGPIRVGAHATLADGTVPLYGADIGPHAHVAAHSVVMKHEHLLAGLCYEGVPTASRGIESRSSLPAPRS
jgi:non-ribosomal peptide synthetase-like protein